jgi:hypothetical protein
LRKEDPGTARAFLEIQYSPARLEKTIDSRRQERPMRTHRFGRKIKLPSTMAIKHQIRTQMARDETERVAAQATADVLRGQQPGEPELLVK